MEAFLLETLSLRGWRRGGEVYWTLADAHRQATGLVKQKISRRVRILPLDLKLQAVEEVGPPEPPADATGAGREADGGQGAGR